MPSRRKAREAVLQSLYEADLSGHDARASLTRLAAEEGLSEEMTAFARVLLDGVMSHRREIDLVIEKAAPVRPTEELAAIDRNILRLAIREFFLDNLTPVSAAINEAVELAKKYGGESSPRFVNGVLGSVSHSTEPQFTPVQEGD